MISTCVSINRDGLGAHTPSLIPRLCRRGLGTTQELDSLNPFRGYSGINLQTHSETHLSLVSQTSLEKPGERAWLVR